MDEILSRMAKDLRDFSVDLGKMIEDSKSKKSTGEPTDSKKRDSRKGKSMQPLTKFHSSKEEAKDFSEMDTIEQFIRNRPKEIFEK